MSKRMLKKLVVMVGLPRSGKSTKAKELMTDYGAAIVNPDSIRLAIHGRTFIVAAEPFVWATAKAMVNALFLAGHNLVVIDATNTTRKRRDDWRYGQWDEREFHVLPTTEEVCLSRCTTPDLIPVVKRMCDQAEDVSSEELDGHSTLSVVSEVHRGQGSIVAGWRGE